MNSLIKDEIVLQIGDDIILEQLFSDGYAKGTNLTLKMKGILPVACVKETDENV